MLGKDKQFTKVRHSIKENRTVNDISWALINGRSYNLLGVASDNSVRIFEVEVFRQGSSDI